MNNTYILIIVIFVSILYMLTYKCSVNSINNQDTNTNNTNNTNKSKNAFKDTGNVKVIDYIKTKLDDLERDIEFKKRHCQKLNNMGSDTCKYGTNYGEIDTNVKDFSEDLTKYTSTLKSDFNQKEDNIYNFIDQLEAQDNQIYVTMIKKSIITKKNQEDINTLYDKFDYLQKDKEYGQLVFDPEVHDPFQDVTPGIIKSETDYSGPYNVIPYQYKNFNNIRIIININNSLLSLNSNPGNQVIPTPTPVSTQIPETNTGDIIFYLIDNDNNKTKFVTFKITEVKILDNFNLLNFGNMEYTFGDDIKLSGIKFIIEKTIIHKDSTVINSIINVLNTLGFVSNTNIPFYLIQSNELEDKVLYNYNKNKLYGNDEDKSYLKSNEKYYRIYNNSTQVLFSLLRTETTPSIP